MNKKINIKSSKSSRIRQGHPWVFSGAIERSDRALTDGELCDVYSGERFLGTGTYHPGKDIAVRLFTRMPQQLDTDFFARRFAELERQKKALVRNTNAYRLVNGEADNLPGLIVDRYADVLVMQPHTRGVENLKQDIVRALCREFSPGCLVCNNAALGRQGAEAAGATEIIYGRPPEKLLIEENGHSFIVDVCAGQKTGFFLDQRENRQQVARYSSGLRVLNCFAYTGGFSVYAAAGKARGVSSVEISEAALELCRQNISLNKVDLPENEFICGDVFTYLEKLAAGRFDMIILDPPAFAHSRTKMKQAIRAYHTINTLALQKLPDYGLLVTSSCTTHLAAEDFIKILHQSSVNADCQLKMVYSSVQPFDHAYNLHFPEGRYLKFMILCKVPFV